MNRRLACCLMLATGLLPSLAATGAETRAPRVAQMTWLAGCWESRRGDSLIEEQWMNPGGGTMIGMSRTVAGDATREFEFMQIREQEGRLVYTAHPSGQKEASFPSIEVTESKVVFENAEHDFPQRIFYRSDGAGALTARIEGAQAGQVKGIDFPMRRVTCPEAGSR
jgi:uncharacterized protein DUF6265